MMNYKDTGYYTLKVDIPTNNTKLPNMIITFEGQFPAFIEEELVDMLDSISDFLIKEGYDTELTVVIPNQIR